jgi:nucleotide-binding universal stress UspA family protein
MDGGRNKLQRILIAVDGSQAADQAVKIGLDVASAQAAEVTFLHVLAPPSTSDYGRILQRAGSQAKRRGVAYRQQLKAGRSVATTIAEFADEINATLIVIGTRGHGLVSSALLGNSCRGLLRRTERPVLIVHAPTHSKTKAKRASD